MWHPDLGGGGAYSQGMRDDDDRGEVARIGAILESRTDQLAPQVVATIRAEVDFYRCNDVVSDDELLGATVDILTSGFRALRADAPFDTSRAEEIGVHRAAVGVPLAAVMGAFRVAGRRLWTATAEACEQHPDIGRAALLAGSSRIWEALDRYTEAMAAAYNAHAAYRMLEHAVERSALVEALLEGRPLDRLGVWEVAQLLGIPAAGPYVVVAALPPRAGQQALPGIEPMLRSLDVSSAWRLLPDVQIGVAHMGSDAALGDTVALLTRLATTSVGVSPRYHNLADTAKSLRYARVAMVAERDAGQCVTVFDDSVLGVAAASAPDVTQKLAEIALGSFGGLPEPEQRLLRETFTAWLNNDGSVAQTAEQLFCHPNTVRNRLRRIEERSGRSLDVPRELAELCLAFEVVKNFTSDGPR